MPSLWGAVFTASAARGCASSARDHRTCILISLICFAWQAKKLFGSIDKDGSGVIDREEVAKLMMALGMQLSRSELNTAMDAMDPNGDNEITFEEFERWYATQDVGQQVTSLRDAFKRADKQGGGTIDREELRQMCTALTLPADTAAALLNQIDLDEDGEWSYQEFLEVLRREDFCTYHSTVGSEQPQVPDKILPKPRKFNLFSGRPYTPPDVFAKRKLMAQAQHGKAFPSARSPSVSSARAGRRSARGSHSSMAQAYGTQGDPVAGAIAHSPRPPPGTMVQTGGSGFTQDLQNSTTDFRHQPKKGYDRSMGQASKLGGIAQAQAQTEHHGDTLDQFARQSLGFDSMGNRLIHAPPGSHNQQDVMTPRAAGPSYNPESDVRRHLPSWANDQVGVQHSEAMIRPPLGAQMPADVAALDRMMEKSCKIL